MTEPTAIDRLYDEASAVLTLLEDAEQISLRIAASDYFRKSLLLATASYFEHRVCDSVLQFVRESTNESPLVESFVRNRAIARQYHQWFKWDENNANQFFGFFGTEFKALMTKRTKESDDLKTSIKAFLELGNERNKLVHQNYATFSMEKTLEEVYALYKSALPFVEAIPRAFTDCSNNLKEAATREAASCTERVIG